jgi:hypothetical protein
MFGRQHRSHRLETRSSFYGLVFWNQNIDAVGFTGDVIVDPFQLLFQRLWGETRAPQNAKAAGATHRRHDIAAMAEGEEWKFRAH